MNLYRNALRIWIAVSSLASFLIGWVFLAHINEPAANTFTNTGMTATPLDLPAIPSVNGLANTNPNSGSVQLFSFEPSTTPSQSATFPGLMTRGS